LQVASIASIHDNVVANSVGNGITVVSDINYIGTNSSGATLGNGGHGVLIDTGAVNANIIGNSIGFNGLDGVAIAATAGNQHAISSNSFRRNNGIPIDLADNGFTPNDSDDGDNGVNKLLNYPVIDAQGINLVGSNWQIPVQFDVDQTGSYQVQLFRVIAQSGGKI
jgi:hypothetical protein